MIRPFATCTVVVPCYNVELYLEEAVQSVLAQVYQDFHLVLVDDGSQDGTRSLARRLAARDPRISLIELPENRGASFARNRGAEATRGPYLAFLDADDTYHPDFLSLTAAVLDQVPLVDAVRVLPSLSIEIDPVRYSAVTNSTGATMLLRRSAFELVGGWPEGAAFREHPAGCEDLALLELLSLYFNVGILPEKLYNYRCRPGNSLERFLRNTQVVDGQLIFEDRYEEAGQKVRMEIERLGQELRNRIRRIVLDLPDPALA